MDNDMVVLIKIVGVCLLVIALVGYLFSTARNRRYIVYADNKEIKTNKGNVFYWSDLKYIRYINKYVMGKGTQNANSGLLFCFKNGKAAIDRRSNIYAEVYNFAEKLPVTKKTVITKGLLKENKI